MAWIRSLRERLAALLMRSRLEAEMDEELRFHLEKETEKNVRAGMTPKEARRVAYVRFGGVERVKEQVRGERGVRGLEELTMDVRYALRTLVRSPLFALVAVLSMALGIGANTAMFSVVNAILVRELPLKEPERLVNIYRDRAYTTADPVSYPDYLELLERGSDVFEDVGGFQFAFVKLDDGGAGVSLTLEMVTGNYFPILGVPAALGRTILPEDHVSVGAHPVVMLSHRFWEGSMGADPSVLGSTIRLSGLPYTIVGVAPRSFTGSLRGVGVDLFAPILMVRQLLPLGGSPLASRGWNSFNPVGRLRDGVGLMDAKAATSRVSRDLNREFPESWPAGDSLMAVAKTDVVFNPAVDPVLVPANFLAMGIVGLVLLIACANLASFLLARASDRQTETALRLALGAGRWRLGRQHLTETLLLAVVGGAAGIVLAGWILRWGLGIASAAPVPLGLDLSLDGAVLGFTALVSVATGIAVGLVPALRATRPDLMDTMKNGGGRNPAGGPARLGNVLVAGQVAVSLVLLVAAGLFIRSFSASQKLDVGFGEQPAALLSFVNPADRMTRDEGRAQTARLLAAAEELPGVTAVGIIGNLHLNTVNTMILDINVDGVAPPPERGAHLVDFTSVDAGFFEAASIPLLRGRNFDDRDDEDGEAVAIINEAMADRFWPGESALGRVFRVEVPGWVEERTVVGIARTTKVKTLAEQDRPFIYLPYAQDYNSWMTLVARGDGTQDSAERLAGDLVQLVRRVHPEGIVFESKTMADHIDVMLVPRRISATFSALFAGLALLLAMIGLYGVVSFAVARRTAEVGIRVSLGAHGGSVVRLMVMSGMRLVFAGAVVGLLLAGALSRVTADFLYGVEPFDPVTFVGVTLVLLVVAAIAALMPALRASKVDPLEALRTQ